MGEIRFVGTGETRGYPYLVCKKRFVGTGETRGYPYLVCKKFLSCIPDKDIRVFYLDRQVLSHPCYLTQERIKITCIKCICFIGSHVSTSSSDVDLHNCYVKKLRHFMQIRR